MNARSQHVLDDFRQPNDIGVYPLCDPCLDSIEVSTFAEGEILESFTISRTRARQLWMELGALIGAKP